MKIDFSKIPILKEFADMDMSNPETKKNVLMILAVLAAVIFFIILVLSGGEKKPDAKAQDNAAVAQTPPIQDGEDRDRIESTSIINMRERNRSDNGAFARRMFSDSDNVEDILQNKTDSADQLGRQGVRQNGQYAQGEVDMTDPAAVIAAATAAGNAEVEKINQIEDQSSGSPRASSPIASASPVPSSVKGGQGSSPAGRRTASSAGSSATTVKSGTEAKRQRIREMGYDPDTGLPLGVDVNDIAVESAQGTEQKPSAQPPEGVEKAVVSVRGKGSMSSFGSGRSTSESGFSSFGSREQEAVASGAKFFKVAFAYDEKVRSGQRVTLRLREKITIDGYELPVNSIVYATCSAKGERLLLKVRNIDINGKAYYLNYDAVDVDWEDGLYCPTKESSKKIKQAAREVGQILSSTAQSLVTGVPGRLISSGTSMAQSSNGEVTVSVTEGYEFYLVPASEE